jgi:hypothetical protein
VDLERRDIVVEGARHALHAAEAREQGAELRSDALDRAERAEQRIEDERTSHAGNLAKTMPVQKRR